MTLVWGNPTWMGTTRWALLSGTSDIGLGMPGKLNTCNSQHRVAWCLERAAPHQAEHTARAQLVPLQLCAMSGGGCDTAGGCSACTTLHHALTMLTVGWACENVSSSQLRSGHPAVSCMLCADSSPVYCTLQVSNLGSLLAVATANATSIESNRGMLGWLNWAGDRLLHLAHRTR